MCKTRQVALIVNGATSYDRKNIQGVVDYAREVGNWSLYVEEDPSRSTKLPDLRTWPGDGIIANFHARKVAEATCGLKIPLVRFGGRYHWGDPALAAAYFEPDNHSIARLAAGHLMDRGFTRLAYCGLPRSRTNAWSDERARAFNQLASEGGFPCWVYKGRQSTARKWADLRRELSAWLESLEKPLGLMACNDARALHVLEACRTIGARVPDDVAVIGVDNDEMMCELTNPPLTSVELGARRMGYQAAALLDQLMAGQRAPRLRFVLKPDGVVIRRSTDALVMKDAKVAAAVRFIRQHACDRIRVENVVQAAKVSRSALQARFKAVMGRTIHAEIQRTRLERAEQLVAHTDLPLKQIASRSGFKHVQHMTTLFRRHTGRTPAEYRRRSRL